MFAKLKQALKSTLFFLRITDEDGILSITHIGCWVVLSKIATERDPSPSEMGSLLCVLALYYGKRQMNKDKRKVNDEQAAALAKMQTKVDAVADKVGAVAATLGFSKR